MSKDLEAVAHRIALEMEAISGDQIKTQNGQAMFFAFGMALSFCYEITTGRSVIEIGAAGMLKWGLELPIGAELKKKKLVQRRLQ